jgi:hypothetical protein
LQQRLVLGIVFGLSATAHAATYSSYSYQGQQCVPLSGYTASYSVSGIQAASSGSYVMCPEQFSIVIGRPVTVSQVNVNFYNPSTTYCQVVLTDWNGQVHWGGWAGTSTTGNTTITINNPFGANTNYYPINMGVECSLPANGVLYGHNLTIYTNP